MIGDHIHVKPHHYDTARGILAHLQPLPADQRTCIAIGGESGSGKSVAAICLRELLQEQGIDSVVLHQDDYFFYPPASNHARRLSDISWVGLQEVNIALMESQLAAFKAGTTAITKPLVHYKDNFIHQETLTLDTTRVLIVEGTYVLALQGTDHRVFMSRSYHQTYAQRMSRGREGFDPFIERVLELEHQLIAPMHAHATVVVAEDYSVSPATAK